MTRTPVCFTLDNFGDAADLFRGNILTPRAPGTNYALEVGIPALLALCERYQLPLTFFVEGWSAEHYPQLVANLQERGHQVGMHGWQHEIWHLLSTQQVDELTVRATRALADVLGEAPTQFRAPGGKNTTHCRQLLKQLGYRLDASLSEQLQAPQQVDGLWHIPYQWSGVDATHWLWRKGPPELALPYWQAELERAHSAGVPYTFIFHSHVMGMQPERLEVGEQLIEHVLNDARFEVLSLDTIAKRAAEVTQP